MNQLTRKPNTVQQGARSSVSAPATRPLTDSSAVAISGAVDRFLARPEICETMLCGSNGYSARLPSDLDARLALWRQWPDAARCAALARRLNTELTEAADGDQVAEIVAGRLLSVRAAYAAVTLREFALPSAEAPTGRSQASGLSGPTQGALGPRTDEAVAIGPLESQCCLPIPCRRHPRMHLW